jgi:gamma-glutamyltranspeptidase/glutathione hydrolase
MNGMIATSQPLASAAGLRILQQGGNAIDAAVAAAAVLCVVEPMMVGPGGDMFAIVWDAKRKELKALNASGRSPQAASIDELKRRGVEIMPHDEARAGLAARDRIRRARFPGHRCHRR